MVARAAKHVTDAHGQIRLLFALEAYLRLRAVTVELHALNVHVHVIEREVPLFLKVGIERRSDLSLSAGISTFTAPTEKKRHTDENCDEEFHKGLQTSLHGTRSGTVLSKTTGKFASGGTHDGRLQFDRLRRLV